MSIYLSIIVIIICLFCFFNKNEKVLVWIFVFTIINGMFEFQIGPAIKVYHFIILLYLPRIFVFYTKTITIKRKINPLMLEFILMMLMGLIFTFVFPFDDPFKHYRSFTQLAGMRTLISGIRLFLEMFTIVIVVYWLQTKTISHKYLFKVISISTVITVLLAFLIYFTNGIVYNIFFPNWNYVSERMLITFNIRGLVGEPKTFGRTCAFLLISNLFYGKYVSKNIRLIAIALSLTGVILSMSASALIVASIGLLLYFFLQRKLQSILVLLIAVLSITMVSNQIDRFNNVTLSKIQYVLSSENEDRIVEGKVQPNEPELFTRFEIFDRAALNFLYFNPQYLLFGVGPNTVSIPASQYLTPRMRNSEVHGYGINTAPATLFVNILSRSGLFGMFLYLIFLLGIYRSLRIKKEKNIFVILSIMAFITNTTIILLFYGVFLYLSIDYTKYNKPRKSSAIQNSVKK